MKECCANCKLHLRFVKFDYSGNGCKHTDMDGYICMAFATSESGEPPVAIWMVGNDEDNDMCECFQQKEEMKWLKNPK